MRLRAKAQAVTGLRPQYPLAALLKASGLARSTYYYQARQAQAADKHAELKGRIGAVYAHHKGRYGYRRITATLRQAGQCVNHKTVQKLMQVLGLKSLVRPKKYRSYRGGPCPNGTESVGAPVRGRQAEPEMGNRCDRVQRSRPKLYLSPVMDLYNGEILAYETSRRPMFKLVGLCSKRSLGSAHRQTRLALRSGLAVSAVQLPSDAGGPIDNAEHVTQGNCLDNAAMESFFGTLKAEFFHLNRFDNIDQLEAGIRRYIRLQPRPHQAQAKRPEPGAIPNSGLRALADRPTSGVSSSGAFR